ncbi:MAG: hypothetical protein WED33_02260 [Bacteroidia bacterium]
MKFLSITVIILYSLVWSPSCKSKKNITETEVLEIQKTEDAGIQKPTKEKMEVKKIEIAEVKSVDMSSQAKNDSLYSVIVSFFSIGSGVDFTVAREFEAYVKGFETENSDYISVERVPWGREGEVDYCIMFNNLNKEKARAFVSKCREITSKTEWVHMNLDSECKRRRK